MTEDKLRRIAVNASKNKVQTVQSAKRSEPVSSKETVEGWLKPYSIGEKLKTLRLRKKLGLVELGRHTGLSAALLSKLERSKLYPTLPTLARIATVFDVGLDHFFTDERKRHVVALAKKQDRQRFPERPGTPEVAYFFETLDYGATREKTQCLLRGLPEDREGETEAAHSRGSRTLVFALRSTRDCDWRTRIRVGGRRRHLLRFQCAPRLLQFGRQSLCSAGRYSPLRSRSLDPASGPRSYSGKPAIYANHLSGNTTLLGIEQPLDRGSKLVRVTHLTPCLNARRRLGNCLVKAFEMRGAHLFLLTRSTKPRV